MIHSSSGFQIEDNREVIQRSDFKTVTPPILYSAGVKENYHNTKFSNKASVPDLEMFKQYVQFDHVGSEFKDRIAMNENFLSSNVFVIDVDAHNGEDLSRIDDINKLGLEYYRVHSKSGEGYHIYFPLSHLIEDGNQYRSAYINLCKTIKELGIQPDEACKNPSRKWFATPHYNRAIYHEGEKFDVLKALSESYRIEGYEAVGGSTLGKGEPSEGVKSEPSSTVEREKILEAWGINLSPISYTPIGDDVEYEPPLLRSGNNALTDKYYHGELNKGQVHEDIPHMINYLIFLEKKGKEFYSGISEEYIPVKEVINRLKERVSYDLGHVDLIDWILDKYQWVENN